MAAVGPTRLTQLYTLIPAGTTTSDRSYEADNASQGTAKQYACLYDPKPEVLVGADGLVELDQPILYVAADDPIQAGDMVSNILAGATVLLAGPAKAELVMPVAVMNAVLCKMVNLRASDIH